MDFYCHPTCTTCKKAEKWLDQHGKSYNWINLKETTPSKELFLEILNKGDRTVKSLFNSSGKLYREMELKDKLADMSNDELADLLSSDGMLVKRPFAIDGDKLSVGFKEETYEEIWG